MPALTSLNSFNAYPKQICKLHRPERYHELLQPLPKSIIPRGRGNSYGDAALNENGHVISMERLNRFLEFDPHQGILVAEAGVTIAQILDLIIPHGWFLPVTPGTQHVTLAGCVASDVHGKNHHAVGSFSNHVLWLELITSQNKIIRTSTQENPDIFWATAGGMGLTGIIGMVCLKLIHLSNHLLAVQHIFTRDLNHTIEVLNQEQDEYSVAWVDTMAVKENLGRSIVMTAHHAKPEELPRTLQQQPRKISKRSPIFIPFNCPNWMLNKFVAKSLQQFYWYKQTKKKPISFMPYQKYFYPLDKIQHWNRFYGKKGFIQYQCVIPTHNANNAYQQILKLLQVSSYPSFLGVFKKFGKENSGMLSFPTEGFTLALDIPILDQGLFPVLTQLDEIVLAAKGRVYLAKDARLTPDAFRQMYPRYLEWQKIKKQLDPEHIFSSSLSRRLDL